MAVKYWVGAAPYRKHKVRFTPVVTGTNTFTLTAGQYSVSVTSTLSTAADVCSLMYTALTTSTTCPPALSPDPGLIGWTNAGGYLECETATAGEWFKFTGTATGGDSWTIATQTEGKGPKILTCPENWSGGAIPANGDTLYFQLKDDTIIYDLDAWSANTYAAVYIENWGGTIGLPLQRTGSYKIFEPNPRFFKAGMTAITVGRINGLNYNPGLLRLDTSNIATTMHLQGSATPTAAGEEQVIWKGTHANNDIYNHRGILGIATERGDVATVRNLYCGFVDNQTSDAVVNVGPGVTLTNWYQTGGLLGLGSTWSGTGYKRCTPVNGRYFVFQGVTPGTIDRTEHPMVA